MPLVSVILPNFNHGKFLRERIESILNQTFRDFELIILDDASSDNSPEIISTYASFPHVSHVDLAKRNSGSTFIQWKKGLDISKGTYIWIAESDDLADPDFLDSFIAVFKKDPGIGVVYCPSVWIDENGEEIHRPDHESEGFTAAGPVVIRNEFIKGSLIYNASSAMFRKELVQQIDFEELVKYKFAGDWYFWVKLLGNTHLSRLGKRLNYFRRHENNVSFKSEKQGLNFGEGFKVVNYILENFPAGFVEKQKAILYWALKVYNSKVEDKRSYIRQLPAGGRLWYFFTPLVKLLYR